MTETEEPGYAERNDDETTEQTGGGVDPVETGIGGEGFDDPDQADDEPTEDT